MAIKGKSYTPEQKEALKSARESMDALIEKSGEEVALWSIRRVLDNIRSLRQLKKRKKRLEGELKTVKAKMDFE